MSVHVPQYLGHIYTKNDVLFLWTPNLTGHPVFYLVTLPSQHAALTVCWHIGQFQKATLDIFLFRVTAPNSPKQIAQAFKEVNSPTMQLNQGRLQDVLFENEESSEHTFLLKSGGKPINVTKCEKALGQVTAA